MLVSQTVALNVSVANLDALEMCIANGTFMETLNARPRHTWAFMRRRRRNTATDL